MPHQEVEEVLAGDGSDGRWIERLRGQLIGVAGESGGEAKDLAFFCDAEGEGAALAGVDGELDFAGQDHEYASCRFLLREQDPVGGIGDGALHCRQILKRSRGELIEELASWLGLAGAATR